MHVFLTVLVFFFFPREVFKMDDWKPLLVLLFFSTFCSVDAQQTGNTLNKLFFFKLIAKLTFSMYSQCWREMKN